MPIRRWEENDLPAVTELLNELKKDLNEEGEIDLRTVRSHYLNMEKIPDVYECFVYETDGRIAGFISLIFYASVFHRNGTALINELVVDPEYRNRKIGRELLEHAIGESRKRDMDEIEVGVMKENVNAVRFYRNHGLNEEYLLLGREFDEHNTGPDGVPDAARE